MKVKSNRIEIIRWLKFDVDFQEWSRPEFAKINHPWLCRAVYNAIEAFAIKKNFSEIIPDHEFLDRDETPYINGIVTIENVPIKWVMGSFIANKHYTYGLYACFEGEGK